MIVLLAVAYEDGWAFVKRGSRIILTQPPYLNSGLQLADDATVEKAISQHGFISSNETFQSWNDLILFLKNKFVEARKEMGLASGEVKIEELLSNAPAYILRDYLDRVENQLLPEREWRPAMNLLKHMISLDSVKSDPDLLLRALGLLERAIATMEQFQKQRAELANHGNLREQFPACYSKFGRNQLDECMKKVRSRQSVWA